MLHNFTMEKLGDILNVNERGVLGYFDELTTYFNGFGQYGQANKRSVDRGMGLQLYEGGPYTFDRVGRGTVFVKQWSACIVGGIQPALLESMFKHLGTDGLVQRFMVNIGSARFTLERQENLNVLAHYKESVAKLWSLVPGTSNDRRTLTFAAKADTIRKDVFKWAETVQLIAEEHSPEFGSHASKFQGLYTRLCLVFQLVTDPKSMEISEDTALRAAKFLREYQYLHLWAFYGHFSQTSGGTSTMKHVQTLAKHILDKQPSEITVGWTQEVAKMMRHRTRMEEEQIFHTLETMRWIEPIELEPNTRGRPFKGKWAVNPLVHTRFKERRAAISAAMAEIAKLDRKASRRTPPLGATEWK